MGKESEPPDGQTKPDLLKQGQQAWEFSELQKRPDVVLAVLEPDQLVAAKERTRFGPRTLSWGLRAQLWALRVYVILMMILVGVSVYRVIGGGR
jgi:hypothetical protein